jgi:hypothetical protein
MNERLNELLNNLPEADKDYLALRDKDIHMVPENTDHDKVVYQKQKQ